MPGTKKLHSLASVTQVFNAAKRDMLKESHELWLEEYDKKQNYFGKVVGDYIPSPKHHDIRINGVNMKVLV